MRGGVGSPQFLVIQKLMLNLRANKFLSSSIDILPTLLDIADIDYDNSMMEYLMPLLTNKISNDERIIYSHWRGNEFKISRI